MNGIGMLKEICLHLPFALSQITSCLFGVAMLCGSNITTYLVGLAKYVDCF
jgi:hypothetical protein